MTGVFGTVPFSADSHGVRLLHANLHQIGLNRSVRCQMNLPCERGPEGRYDVESLLQTTGTAFSKFNPLAIPPACHAPLAPLRDEVVLIDPCSGQLSAGAEVDLATKGRHKFIDFDHVPSGLLVPPGYRERPQTPPARPSAVPYYMSGDKAWNSRKRNDSTLRADLGGSTSHFKLRPPTCFNSPPGLETKTSDVNLSGPTKWIDKAALRYIYTSSAQSSFEDVRWDVKLPPRLKPPATTLEKMADPVNQHFTLKRYNSKPELWQSVEAQWKRHQLRAKNEVRKPISFASPCPKSGQIPLYSGVVAFKNIDGIDDMHQDVYPLTMQRTTLPPYTPTTHRPTIPGYTGKAKYDVALNSGFRIPVLPSSADNPWATQDPWVPAYGRTAPLSRMVTTVHPHNPFRHPKR